MREEYWQGGWERIFTEVQGGFRSGRRYLDQWLVLRGVCEEWKREKKNSYLAFLDISEAYDSGERDCGIR